MKFMVVWSIPKENLQAVSKRAQEDSEPLDGIEYLGRWHEGTGRGYSLVETDDPVALNKLATYWADLIGAKIPPVVSDEELPKA